ncbi:MAG: sugar phosphate isomerase/epimerase, partial [Chloroflexi bacterium]|nr:sugar phosphate isomerase/epimerase [Chloroflexota bacterium]
MKYGAHCYIFTDHWSDDQLYLFDTARDLGLDCFEISVGDDVHFNPQTTRDHASAVGLELILSPGALWPREYDLSAPDPTRRSHGLAWHKRQVDLTASVGGTAYTGALYGHPGVLRYRPLSDDEYSLVAENLYDLAEHGARNGVKIVLEPMSHFRTHVINTADQAVCLIARANHPNLHVLLDTYHMVTEVRDYEAAIRTTQDRLCGLHACEG